MTMQMLDGRVRRWSALRGDGQEGFEGTSRRRVESDDLNYRFKVGYRHIDTVRLVAALLSASYRRFPS